MIVKAEEIVKKTAIVSNLDEEERQGWGDANSDDNEDSPEKQRCSLNALTDQPLLPACLKGVFPALLSALVDGSPSEPSKEQLEELGITVKKTK